MPYNNINKFFSLNILSLKSIKDKIWSKNYKYFNFIIPILIVISSFKIIGYVSLFIFLIPYVIVKKKEIFSAIKNAEKIEILVLIYFIYFIFSVIYGSHFIKDLRIILYWIPFSFVIIGAYFKNIYDLKNNKFYRNNYINIIYKSSFLYFIIYFIANICSLIYFKNPYQIQDNYWMGSSGAFSISSLLLFSLYKKWEKINFKLYSKYFFVFLFYIYISVLNDSRLGLIYIITFSLTIIIRYFQSKNFISLMTFAFTIMIAYTCYSSVNTIAYKISNADFKNYLNRNIIYESKNIIYETKNIFNHKDNRSKEILKGYKKFLEYPNLNKLFGTGWYSSRITINANQEEIKKGTINHKNYNTFHMQGIVALFLDTGLIGSIFSFILFTFTIFLQFQLKEILINRLFYISMVCLIGLCLFIGYPLVNIAYILFLLPNGINNTHNHLIKNSNKS